MDYIRLKACFVYSRHCIPYLSLLIFSLSDLIVYYDTNFNEFPETFKPEYIYLLNIKCI